MKALAASVGLLLLSGCAQSADFERDVVLSDTEITVSGEPLEAGSVRFAVTNEGTEIHELEVFSGAFPGIELPVFANAADTTGLTVLDEVYLVPGADGSVVVDLSPGTYLLICNLPGHYARGMSATITVGAGP